MSLIFLKLTFITFWITHWKARRTQPSLKEGYKIERVFNGTTEEFFDQLQKHVLSRKNFLLLEKTPTQCLISEASGLFNFGSFYHIHLKVQEEGLLVCIHVQPKLVSHSDGQKEDSEEKFKELELQDSQQSHSN